MELLEHSNDYHEQEQQAEQSLQIEQGEQFEHVDKDMQSLESEIVVGDTKEKLSGVRDEVLEYQESPYDELYGDHYGADGTLKV